MNQHYRLCLVTDEQAMLGRNFTEVVAAAVRGGVTMVQLREKLLDTRAFLQRALELKSLLTAYDIPLIINDRMDIALAVEAEGVHVGQLDMPVELVRKWMPEEKMVGLSIENIPQGITANRLAVSYYGIGPVYTTPTKTDSAPAIGLEGIREMKQLTHHPLMAIGGLNSKNAASVIQAGADGIAVVSAICSAKDPEASAKELRTIIDEELGNRRSTTD